MANILVVDDEKGYREVLKVIFESEGHSVEAANNGLTAVEILRSGHFDVCISDVKMPDMDGVELLRTVREILPDLAVVLMTAFGTIDTAREAFKLGADDFIQKPFNNDELKLIVQRALERQALVARTVRFASPSESRAARLTSSANRRRCRSCTKRSRWSPAKNRPCSSPANRAAAKNSSPVRSTISARVPRNRSSRSTAAR